MCLNYAIISNTLYSYYIKGTCLALTQILGKMLLNGCRSIDSIKAPYKIFTHIVLCNLGHKYVLVHVVVVEAFRKGKVQLSLCNFW